MEWFWTLIVSNPTQAIAAGGLVLSYFLSRALFNKYVDENKALKKSSADVITQMSFHRKAVADQFKEHKAMLDAHKDDMGKFSKAIQGDLLKTSERLFELKQEMLRELMNLKAMSHDTERNLTLANEVSKIAIHNLDEKLGRVIVIEKTLDAYSAQITKLQERAGSHAADLSKHQQWFATIGEALKANKTQLQKLESDFKRDKKG